MLCDACGTDIPVDAKFCPKCGAAMESSSPLDEASRELDRMQEELGAELDQAAASLDAELDDLTGALADTGKGFAPAGAKPMVHPQEVTGLLQPQSDEVNQSARFVFESPYIQGNKQYEDRVDRVTFAFADNVATVNAFATDHAFDMPDGSSITPPAIVFLGGLASATRLAAAALGAHIRFQRVRALASGPAGLANAFQMMGQAIVESEGALDARTSQAIFQETIVPALQMGEERFVSLARSYAAAMDMFVVAHEAGHIALGHTLGQALNYDVSRNQEREADSFASSSLSTSPFREYLFLGQVFVTIIFAWVEHAARARQASTHPLAPERLDNALTSNSQTAREVAGEFGLSREKLMELLPRDGG